MSREPASEDFVDRAITSERILTDEKFAGRDKAVKLLVENARDNSAKYLAAIALALALINSLIQMVRR